MKTQQKFLVKTDSQLKLPKVVKQLATPTDLTQIAVVAITDALNPLIADAFALYVKTKTFTGIWLAPISGIIICFLTSKLTRFSLRRMCWRNECAG